MPDLNLFIPITKVDAAKRLVYGVATAEIEDKSGEICDYASTKPNYEKWSGDCAKTTNGKSYGNLRSMHGPVAAGKVTAITFNDPSKQIEICAKVVDDAEWLKVEEGVYTGFSQGGSYERRWKDEDGLQRYTANPTEISLVDLPCLPTATFQMIKADGVAEQRPFRKKENTSMASTPAVTLASKADIEARARELAKAAGAGDWTQFMAEAEKSFAKKAGKKGANGKHGADHEASGHKGGKGGTGGEANGEYDGGDGGDGEDASSESDGRDGCDGKDATSDGDGDDGMHGEDRGADKAAKIATPVDGDEWEQVWRSKRDGAVFRKKDELRAHLAKLDAAASVAETTEPAMKALADLGKRLGIGDQDASIEKRDFSDDERKKMAESGEAEPDRSYPIKTAKDVENAVKDFGRSNGSASDKAHIIARAKAIGAESSLPDEWIDKTAKSAGLEKTYPKMTPENRDKISAMHEHTSALMDKCMKADRFSASDMDKIRACGNHCNDILMQEQHDQIASGGMAYSALIGELEKLGARNNAGDQQKIQAVHDHAVSLGAMCKDDGMEMSMKADLEKRTAEVAALKSAIDSMVPMLKNIQDQIKQPIPLPISGAARFVEKGHEGGRQATLQDQLGDMLSDPSATEKLALLAFKKSHENGHPVENRFR